MSVRTCPALVLNLLKMKAFKLAQGEVDHVMNPDPYRGVFGSDSTRYAKEVQDHIDYGTAGQVAGFIAETFQVAIFIT